MTALSDPTRCRMLMLLEKHELTVSELCAVLQMPQSTVSRHLKTLSDDDWVASRRDGTSRFYSMPVDDLDSGAKRLWPLIREQVASTEQTDPGSFAQGIKGRVTDERGNPVPSATVWLMPGFGPESFFVMAMQRQRGTVYPPLAKATTDAQGRFAVGIRHPGDPAVTELRIGRPCVRSATMPESASP